jgi:glycine dehydrogenase subunit 1
MGPQGMIEIGQAIMQRVHYATQTLSKIKHVTIQFPRAAHFREFILDFSRSTRPVVEINLALRERGIFGGYDISRKWPQFQNHAVYCVTEVHTKDDIDVLAQNLAEVLE